VIPSGHRAYLEAKAEGDNSIPGKARCGEATKAHAGRGPDGKVKAGLLEPKCPLCISTARIRWMTSVASQMTGSQLGPGGGVKW